MFLDKFSFRALRIQLSSEINEISGIYPVIELSNMYGHLSTNIALRQKNSKEFAKELVVKMCAIPNIHTTVEGPGFINFKFEKKVLLGGLKELLQLQNDYGKPYLDTKISVDHTDVNPTGPAHIGHGRLAVVGDIVCRFMSWCGAIVYRDYLWNDSGNQIHALLESVKIRIAQLNGDIDAQIPKDGYHGEYLIDIAKEAIKQNPVDLLSFTLEQMKNEIMHDLKDLNVCFDHAHSEREMLTEIESSVSELKDYTYIGQLPKPKSHEGEWISQDLLLLRQYDDHNSDEDIVLRKHNGDWTYTAGDIAFHKRRIDRKVDRMINVFGSDHHGHKPKLQRIMQLLAPSVDFEIIFCQIVNLVKDGQQIRMSKRAGNFLMLKDAINDLSPDILRIAMLMRSANSPLTIDLNLFQSLSSDNPYYYLQYAFARTHSVLRAAEKVSIKIDSIEDVNFELLEQSEELAHIAELLKWPLCVEKLIHDLGNVHHLLLYAQSIAKSFHSWWCAGTTHQMRRFIIEENIELSKARLVLVYATQIVLKNIFTILGIKGLESL